MTERAPSRLDAPARAFLAGVIHAAITGSDPPPSAAVDWTRLEKWQEYVFLVSFLYPVLERSAMPAALKATLQSAAQASQLRRQLMLRELYRVVPALEAAGCEPIVLKGPALLHTAYRGKGRVFDDLDLLVPSEAREGATSLLTELGYRPDKTLRTAEFYERYHFHRRLRHQSGMVLELHWDLTRRDDYVRFDLAAFRAGARVIESEGARLRVPSDDDQLLHAASQQVQDSFVELRRIIDAAMLLRSGSLDITKIIAGAHLTRLATPLWVLLQLVRVIAGIEPPSALEAALRPGAFRRACLGSLDLPERIFSNYAGRRAGFAVLLRCQLTPDFGAAFREIARYLVPGEAQWLDLKYARVPSPAVRIQLSLRRLLSAAKIVGFQAFCLARHLIAR